MVLLPGCACCGTECTVAQSKDLWTRLQSKAFSVTIGGTTVAVPAYAVANNVAAFGRMAGSALNTIKADSSRMVWYNKAQAANVHRGTYPMALSLSDTKWLNNGLSGTARNGYITFVYQNEFVSVNLLIYLGSSADPYYLQLPGETCYVSMRLRTILKYKTASEPISSMIDAGQYREWTISSIPSFGTTPGTWYAAAVGTPDVWQVIPGSAGFAVGYPAHTFQTTGTLNGMWFSDIKPAALAWSDGTMLSRCQYLTPSTTAGSYVPVAGVNAACGIGTDVIEAPTNGTFVERSAGPLNSIRSSFEPVTSGVREDTFLLNGIAPATGPAADRGIQNGQPSDPTISLSMS